MSNEATLKFRVGNYLYPVKVVAVPGRLELHFKYNAKLLEEVRSMEGAKWHGYDEKNPRKIWSVKNSRRNRFQIKFLAGGNPYEAYDKPLQVITPSRNSLYAHQIEMASHMVTRKQCLIACEMGTGKTLSAIEAIEASGFSDWYWVAPRAALYSVQLEFIKWKAKITPKFFTYEGLRKLTNEWTPGKKPPQGIVFDESSRLKTPTAQRSQAAYELADLMRESYDDRAWIIEMSGSPAPKSPADWWYQCEIACPGFLREGSYFAFQNRLAVIRKEESIAGGFFNKIVTWKDDPNKCSECGKFKEAPEHDLGMGGHPWVESKDEVSFLHKRMNNLVLVKFKKDCLDLPEKQYRTIKLKPTGEVIRSARLIEAKAPSAVQALTLLRELSDGFQYKEEEIEGYLDTCEICKGAKTVDHWYDADDPDNPIDQASIGRGHRIVYDEAGVPCGELERPLRIEQSKKDCPRCHGDGQVCRISRVAKEFPTPKENALRDILDEHDDVGRIVIYAAFTGSVDRVVKTVRNSGWNYIRVDGRGWDSDVGGTPTDLLQKFQRMGGGEYEKLAFIGQPGAAGMGLNLTASPTIVYWSNDFNAESRIQSEDRIHRPGMDKNLGATIIDLVHLPSDQLVIDNLKRKRKLQDLTLGQLRDELSKIGAEDDFSRTFDNQM